MKWILISTWVCIGYCPVGQGHIVRLIAEFTNQQQCNEFGRQTIVNMPYGNQYIGTGYICTMQYGR